MYHEQASSLPFPQRTVNAAAASLPHLVLLLNLLGYLNSFEEKAKKKTKTNLLCNSTITDRII